MTEPDQRFRLASIVLPAILPTLAFTIGEGAIIPVIPIIAVKLGSPLAVAGLIAAMLLVGHLVGDLPSGWLISRIGERSAMIWASLLAMIALVIASLAASPWLLGFAIFLVGVATAVFALARHAFLTTFVPVPYRARALALLAGSFRFGYFVGPFLAAVVLHFAASPQAVLWIHIVGCAVAATLLLTMRDPAATFAASRTIRTDPEVGAKAVGTLRTIVQNRGVLARLGVSASLIGAVRASRQVILPLWAVSIGVSDTNTALIIGAAGAIDFALFYVTGQIMDRFGRMWTAVPSMIGLGLGLVVLSLTHDLSSNVVWFIVVAMALGVANGLGTGILLTLGADLADPANPGPFLGAWRFMGDSGSAVAPLLVSAFTAVASLAVASGIMGISGLVGAVMLVRYLPRFLPHSR